MKHVIKNIYYVKGGDPFVAPTECECGWEGTAAEFREHRLEAVGKLSPDEIRARVLRGRDRWGSLAVVGSRAHSPKKTKEKT
jgi:hypothetical protein